MKYWEGGNNLARKIENNPYLSTEEKLFLILLKFNDQRDDYVVTLSLTQQGLHKKLKCNLSHISRILNKNESNGFIKRKKTRIDNGSRKRYVFFLTDEGIAFAKKIEEMIRK